VDTADVGVTQADLQRQRRARRYEQGDCVACGVEPRLAGVLGEQCRERNNAKRRTGRTEAHEQHPRPIKKRTKRGPKENAARYRAIASEYERLLRGGERAPAKRIAERYNVSRATARTWIFTARKHGLLTLTKQGCLVSSNVISTIVAMGMKALRERVVLAKIVNRDYDEREITGQSQFSSVNVMIPAPVASRSVSPDVVPPAVTA